MAVFNLFSLFKKGYTYGEILLFLYKNADYRYELLRIKEKISEVDINHFYEVIDWLLNDNLIVHELYRVDDDQPILELYRISYQGFAFIKDLKEKRSNRIINSIGIFVACFSVVISSVLNIRNNNSISKVEVVKFPYRDTIKQKIAAPISNPCATPIKTAGKSSILHDKQKKSKKPSLNALR